MNKFFLLASIACFNLAFAGLKNKKLEEDQNIKLQINVDSFLQPCKEKKLKVEVKWGTFEGQIREFGDDSKKDGYQRWEIANKCSEVAKSMAKICKNYGDEGQKLVDGVKSIECKFDKSANRMKIEKKGSELVYTIDLKDSGAQDKIYSFLESI